MNNIQRARNIVTCPVDVEITIRDAHVCLLLRESQRPLRRPFLLGFPRFSLFAFRFSSPHPAAILTPAFLPH